MAYFYDLILMLLGEYVPVTKTVAFQLADGSVYEYQTVADGIASINVTYILAFIMVLFILKVIYGVTANTVNNAINLKGGKRIL